MATHDQLSEAKRIIEQALKDGLITQEQIEDLTDEEYIKLTKNINTFDTYDR